jgi:hypothetical protein
VNTLINTQLRVDEAKLKARRADELLPKLLEQLKIEQERISKIPFRRTFDDGVPITTMREDAGDEQGD